MDATSEASSKSIHSLPSISPNARLNQIGITIAGGHEYGNALNQLRCPYGLYVDEDQTTFISELGNHRIVEWKYGAKRSKVVAGGNGHGNRIDQLYEPSGVIVDKGTDSLIICDSRNRRVMRWSRRHGTTYGEIVIENIACEGLTMDDSRFLYVSDSEKHEVRRYQMGDTQGILVAGGNGEGDRLNQLNCPTHVFVDQDRSMYVSDSQNHRVIKWVKDATEGIVVAGGHGEMNDLTHLSHPQGLFIDSLGTVYVAEYGNHRVMRWCKGRIQGDIIAGGNDQGAQANQLQKPVVCHSIVMVISMLLIVKMIESNGSQ